MAVPKRKRQESQFEVIKHLYRLRFDITDLLLRDFGYSKKKADQSLEKMFGGKKFDELNEDQKNHYLQRASRNEGFEEWFIGYQRDTIMDCLKKIGEYVFSANSIYPTNRHEYKERRMFQNKALGQCFRLLQELQYTIEILPVNINKYEKFVEGIEKEIRLLRGWRKKDNKLYKGIV